MGCTQAKQSNTQAKYRKNRPSLYTEEFKSKQQRGSQDSQQKIPISLLKTQSNLILNEEDLEEVRTASNSQEYTFFSQQEPKRRSKIYKNYDYLPQETQQLIRDYQRLNYDKCTDLFPLHEQIQSSKNNKKMQLNIKNNKILERRNIKVPQEFQQIKRLQPLKNSLEHDTRDMSIKAF